VLLEDEVPERDTTDRGADDGPLLAFRAAVSEANGTSVSGIRADGAISRIRTLLGAGVRALTAGRDHPLLVVAALAVVLAGAAVVLAGPVVGAGPPMDPDLPMAGTTPSGDGTAMTGMPIPGSAGTAVTAPLGNMGPGAGGDAPGMVAVHVTGAVHEPGVWEVPSTSWVRDLLAVAGGARPDADLDRINLAATVVDGSRLYVPAKGETTAPPLVVADGLTSSASVGASGGSAGRPAGGMVALNTATAVELETLPGVGAATAAAIIEHRLTRGPFLSIEGLLEVRGIGPAKLAAMRDRLVL
jgi:competence protein ComEA